MPLLNVTFLSCSLGAFNLPVGVTLFDFQLQPISIGGSFHASVECNLSILFIRVFQFTSGG